MLYAFDRLSIGYRGGLPGVHAMFGGTNWTFYHSTRLGDRVRVKVIFKDLIERPSTFAGRAWQQISALTFTNQDGLLLAETRTLHDLASGEFVDRPRLRATFLGDVARPIEPPGSGDDIG
jgi:hypothetical protein